MIKPLEELDIQYIFNPILRVEGVGVSQNFFWGGLSLDISRINIVKKTIQNQHREGKGTPPRPPPVENNFFFFNFYFLFVFCSNRPETHCV